MYVCVGGKTARKKEACRSFHRACFIYYHSTSLLSYIFCVKWKNDQLQKRRVMFFPCQTLPYKNKKRKRYRKKPNVREILFRKQEQTLFKTCGIEKTLKIKKIKQNIEGFYTRKNSKYTKKDEWINGRKDKCSKNTLDPTPKINLVWKWWIPPRREIWSGSNGSHRVGKSRWEIKEKRKDKQQKLTLTLGLP